MLHVAVVEHDIVQAVVVDGHDAAAVERTTAELSHDACVQSNAALPHLGGDGRRLCLGVTLARR